MEKERLGWRVVLLGVIAVLLTGCGVSGSQPDEPATAEAATETRASTATRRSAATRTATEAGSGREMYVNEAYGFSFRYPTAWQVVEGRNFVSLNQGTMSLVIGYRHASEEPNICCRERMGEGELVASGSVTCQGEKIDRALLRCDGETKAVLYQGTEEIALGDRRFLFYLEDFNADYEAATIPKDVQAEMDRVIGSLETFEPERTFVTSTPRPTRLPPTGEPTSTPAPATEATATPRPAIAKAQPDGANVRSGPGTGYALLVTLEGGEQVDIVGRHGDWWQIRYRDGSAWIYDGVVTTENASAVPQVASVPTKVPSSPTQIPTPAPATAVEEKRWIDVDLSEQRLTAYEDGEPVRSTLVSTGLSRTPTVTGQFRIWIKLRYDDMSGPDYYLEDVPHVMYFYQGYGLHAATWHDNFGQPMSHGCVNLPPTEAEWLFNFADVGTLVNVRG